MLTPTNKVCSNNLEENIIFWKENYLKFQKCTHLYSTKWHPQLHMWWFSSDKKTRQIVVGKCQMSLTFWLIDQSGRISWQVDLLLYFWSLPHTFAGKVLSIVLLLRPEMWYPRYLPILQACRPWVCRVCHGTPRILADQLILFQPGGTDYAHLITTGTPRFSDLPTALYLHKI